MKHCIPQINIYIVLKNEMGHIRRRTSSDPQLIIMLWEAMNEEKTEWRNGQNVYNQNNRSMNLPSSPWLSKITGAVHLALLGLASARQIF